MDDPYGLPYKEVTPAVGGLMAAFIRVYMKPSNINVRFPQLYSCIVLLIYDDSFTQLCYIIENIGVTSKNGCTTEKQWLQLQENGGIA